MKTLTKEERAELRAQQDERHGETSPRRVTVSQFLALLDALDVMERERDDLDGELYTTGKIADCNHSSCHTPIAAGWCVRHELAVRGWRIAEGAKWRRRYDALRETEEREIAAFDATVASERACVQRLIDLASELVDFVPEGDDKQQARKRVAIVFGECKPPSSVEERLARAERELGEARALLLKLAGGAT